jgi:hypothetical protein
MPQSTNGLTRAVGSEVADHLTWDNLQIKVVQGVTSP